MHKYNIEQIKSWLEFLRTRNGQTITRLFNGQHTDNPSIQGIWNPFLNKNPKLSVLNYPSEQFQKPIDAQPTATEQILELLKKQQQQQQQNQDKLKNVKII